MTNENENQFIDFNILFIVFTEGGNVQPAMAKDIGPPKFITAFTQSSTEMGEGQSTHMEAKLTPIEDPNLKVEWFKDGKPLPTGHRFRYNFFY